MKLTSAKLMIINSKWHSRLSKDSGPKSPDFQQELANRTGLDRREISKVLNGDIYTQRHQELVSKEVGISVGKLFGPNAWFRVAAQRLQEKELSSCSG